MRFESPLVRGTLLRREKRFLAWVRLDDGREIVAHTANTGSMRGCARPGAPVYVRHDPAPHRKLHWTWELVEDDAGGWLGIHTGRANGLVQEAIEGGLLPLRGARILREVRYGDEGSRIDLLLEGPGRCWVEVKNATWIDGDVARFPDAPTERGRKHLRELARQVAAGDRAALVFVVQRLGVRAVGAADAVDPDYGRSLRQVAAAGVQLFGLEVAVSPTALTPTRALPVDLSL